MPGSYRVLLFFDGDNGGDWRVGQYTITTDGGGTQLFQGSGEDSEEVNFNSGSGNNADGVLQIPVGGGSGNLNWPNSPNNNEGNFLITDVLGADTITITSKALSWGGTPRAPLNGIQIVEVPEPGPVVLALTAALGALAVWRRKRGA